MKRLLLFFACLLSISTFVFGQNFRGKVLDSNKKSIPNATIYIQETANGIMADENGNFQTSLKAGEYTVEFRSIGYETVIKKLNIGRENFETEVILPDKPIQLNEVSVNPSNEDPAYDIMRKTIAQAPYHQNQLSAYTSENYMKGSGKLEKLSGLMKMGLKDKRFSEMVGKLLVYESKNIVNYTRPNKYTQKVIAFKSSFPKELEPKNGVTISTSSIYQSYFYGGISPLSPQAFQYYKFKFEDVFSSGKHQIYKIRFIPKLKNGNLNSGKLYIVENDWSIYAAEFESSQMGMRATAKINYQEINPGVFLPITFESSAKANLLGIKMSAGFFSSTKYTSITLNPAAINAKADKMAMPQKAKMTKKQQKALEELQKIAEKEQPTTADALKMAKLSQALNYANDSTLKKQKSLEIKPRKGINIEKDSLAYRRDSVYWDSIRTVPLKKEELISYKYVDSLPKFDDIVTNTGSEISISEPKGDPKTSWLMGGSHKIGKSASVYYEGLGMGCLTEYNFVDGFWLGQQAGLNIKTSKNTTFNIEPWAYYVTARKSAVWGLTMSQQYAPLRNGKISFSLGNTTEDIQRDMGFSRLFNSAAALDWGGNAISLYQKKYITLQNSMDIANGLNLTLGASHESRYVQQNHTTYNFAQKPVSPNFPEERMNEFPAHTATKLGFYLSYTPRYYYEIRNGRKEYRYSNYPTFGLMYVKAVPIGEGVKADYDKINLSVRQKIKLSLFDNVEYIANIGGFLSKKQLFAPDYHYFATAPMLATQRNFNETFNLLPNYTYLNNKWWESHVTWESDYLLLKRIPFMQSLPLNEALHLNTLWNLSGKPYNELGYSIGLDRLVRVGAFGSFNGGKFDKAGVRISLNIFELIRNRK